MNIHIKTAWDHVRRAPFQAMAAIFVLTITFFVITIITILGYSSSQVLKYFETRPQVITFLKDDITPEKISALQNKLEADNRVSEVSYISKEQALEIYKKATAGNPLLSELVSPSIFPASLEFSLVDLSYANDLIEEIKGEEIVDQVGFTASLGGEETLSDVVNRLRTFSNYIKIGGGAFALLLTSTSFLVLIVIIGMRMTSRRGEIEVLDLIGATPGFIRSPIIYEAIIYAITGVFIGWLIALLLVLYATPSLISYFGEIPVVPKDTLKLFGLFGLILGAEFLIGLFLAVSGSILAVLRVKRK
ncbi:MAG: Cell division protein [Candidatus Woesebacteria bacterium GW2011_GWB1_39_12]|uniref:Cell division protein FtsX n=2 Tax=Candidatus Woeseibacteriota TaxID=1752722 RepID=A0A0G0M2C3_9BACT|nr:MAG: Cell division protein [Candidatus Woesebacteria bacterium GW2011_GWA1_39_12]KKR00920.1 MAG: Cell division protein [Candidatus Woesebacteria bacterium GW2011_GWB1_39_12]